MSDNIYPVQPQNPGYRKKVYPPPTEGLNDRLSPLLLRESEGAEFTNFRVNKRNILEKYPGYMKDGSPFPNSTDSFIRFLLDLKIGASTDVLLMAAQDNGNANASYKVDFKKTIGDGTYSYIGYTTGTATFTNGNTAVTGSGTAWSSNLKAGDKIKRGSDADTAYVEIQTVNSNTSLTLLSNYGGTTGSGVAYNARIVWHKSFVPRGVLFNNTAVLTNGSETPMTYNNTTLSLITDTDAPKAAYVENHKRRVFMANTSSAPSTVYWSAVDDATSWDAASLESVFPKDGGSIVSIRSFADSLFVFKNGGTYSNLYQIVGSFGQDSIGYVDYIRKIDTPDNIGLIAERSITVNNGYLYFLAQTGLYRVDPRLYVEKISWNAETFISNLAFTTSVSQIPKSYSYVTTTQWNTGTVSGMRTDQGTGNTLTNYFDSTNINSVKSGPRNSRSMVMDSSYNIHVAYYDTNGKLNYTKWTASDNSTTNTVLKDTSAVFNASDTKVGGVSIDVAPNGNIGIAFPVAPGTLLNTSTTDHKIYFIENVSGTWSTEEEAYTITSHELPYAVSFRYNSSSDPRIVSLDRQGDLLWTRRVLGVYSAKVTVAAGIGSGNIPVQQVILNLTSSGLSRISTVINGPTIKAYKNTSDGGAFTNFDSIAFTNYDGDSHQMTVDGSDNTVLCFADGSGGLKTRVCDTAVSTAVSTTSNSFCSGFAIYSGNKYIYCPSLGSGLVSENLIFSGTKITNTQAASTTIDRTTNNVWNGDKGLSARGPVFASIEQTQNANQLLLRRVCFVGTWTGPETSDSTLSAWGAYQVNGPVSNSGTILYEIALAASSPATSYATINPNAVVSSDATMIFNKPRITFTLGSFASPTVDGLVLNYTGTGGGVDPKQAIAFTHNNESYFFCGKATDTANGYALILDIASKFIKTTYPVSAVERFRGSLYAGKATNGDLLILNQGYNFGGSSYSAEFQTKEDLLSTMELDKEIVRVYVLYEVKDTGTFTFSYRLDSYKTYGGSDWVTPTNGIVDQTTAPLTGGMSFSIGKRASSIQMKITQADKDVQCGIIGFVVLYRDLNIR